MSELTVNFAFEIGDLVYFVDASHDRRSLPKRFVIYERIAQECHGGVQKLYKVNHADGLVPEIVLTRERPRYEPVSDMDCEAIKVDEYRAQLVKDYVWQLFTGGDKENSNGGGSS